MRVNPFGERPTPPKPASGWVPFALGFRPFFSLAGVFGAILISLWIGFWPSGSPPSPYFFPVDWHSHEMLFGFTMAIIAGFLLTAVPNWTGLDTVVGKPLALLALLWLAGRLLPFVPSLPIWLVSLVDMLFIPALTIALAPPLIRAENRINRILLPILVAMAVANLLYHLQGLELASTRRQGIFLMLNLILLLLIFIGGRILPFFTKRALKEATPRFNKHRELAVYTLFMLWILAELMMPKSWLLSPLTLGVALTQTWRLIDWHHWAVWRQPILWILFNGLIWLCLGFLLKTLALFELYPDNLATHALTVGAVGIFTFGMMARVALAHTGREITPNRSVVGAFILLNIAVGIRVFLPTMGLIDYETCITLSGTLWILSYLIFALTYLPILLRSRIDGLPG